MTAPAEYQQAERDERAILRWERSLASPAVSCPTCGHKPSAARRATVRVLSAPCADPHGCWDWQHTCRTRIKFSRRLSRSAYAPAVLRGRVVPQERITA